MRQTLLLGFVAIMLFAACKKDKKEVTLVGKWNIENIIEKETFNGVVDQSTENGNGATMDFQSNGTVVLKRSATDVESASYTIKPDSKVEIDGDVFDIKNLTASSVTLYNRQDLSGTYSLELTINLKR